MQGWIQFLFYQTTTGHNQVRDLNLIIPLRLVFFLHLMNFCNQYFLKPYLNISDGIKEGQDSTAIHDTNTYPVSKINGEELLMWDHHLHMMGLKTLLFIVRQNMHC